MNVESWGKRTHIWYSYNSIGSLLRDGIIKIEQVDDLVGNLALLQWSKYGVIIKEMRVKHGFPRIFHGF